MMMAQYPSCPFAAESVPKNTHKGKSMKLLVPGFQRPVEGGCWENRFVGAL